VSCRLCEFDLLQGYQEVPLPQDDGFGHKDKVLPHRIRRNSLRRSPSVRLSNRFRDDILLDVDAYTKWRRNTYECGNVREKENITRGNGLAKTLT